MSKLRIGLLLDSERIDSYVLDLLGWASGQDNLEVVAAVVCEPAAGGSGPRGWLANLCLRCVVATESMLIRSFSAHRAHLARYPLAQARPGIVIRACGAGASDAAQDLAAIRSLRLDLLVAPGPQLPTRQFPGAARLGTIILDYRGKRATAASPPGFWECYRRDARTGFEIALAAAGGAPRVVLSGAFPTKYLFLLNQANLYRNALAQLKGLLKTVAATRCLPPDERSRPYSGPCLGRPRPAQLLAYQFKVAWRLGAKGLLRLANVQEKWGISCIYADWKNAALWRSTRIAAPRGHFWADPFLSTHEGKTYCFVEDYVYRTRRGHIGVLEITEQGALPLGDCIREDFHMSFPFLFRYQGELYMCPESSQARQVRLYRCKSFPLEWELHAVAMEGVSAADSMFFEHGGKWWMLTNIDRSGLNDHCFELCLFHAASPFARDWTPHPRNPLRIDPDGGRNAGLILEDGRIFRAAQRQGFDQYGQGLALYEILELNERSYVEQLVAEIDPSFQSGLRGSHHVSTTGQVTVVDHVGRAFCP